MTVEELRAYLSTCNPNAVVRVRARYGSIAVETADQTPSGSVLILGFGGEDS